MEGGVLRYLDMVCLVKFEDIFEDYNSVIDRVNNKYKRSFAAFDNDDIESIYSMMKKNNEKLLNETGILGKASDSQNKASFPMAERSDLKQEVIDKLKSDCYAELMCAAKNIYRELI